MRKPLSQKQAHEYWRNPPRANRHLKYVGRDSYRSVVRLCEKHARKDARILELGCNVGTTLDALYSVGFGNLSGIEINPQAVEMMAQLYGDMYAAAEIHVGTLEDVVPRLGEYDLIFSKAVLCHLHPKGEHVLAQIAERTPAILTIEDEQTDKSGRHWARNYRRVFARFGFNQVEFVHHPQGMGGPYVGRYLAR